MLAAVDARGPNWTEREPGEEGAVLTARCVLGLVAKRLRSFKDRLTTREIVPIMSTSLRRFGGWVRNPP